MKKINLAITGCMGRMGQQIIKSVKIDNDFKLYGTEETPPQLYNIAEDNAEAHDLSSQQQSPLSNLISRYNIWNQSVQNSALGWDY